MLDVKNKINEMENWRNTAHFSNIKRRMDFVLNSLKRNFSLRYEEFQKEFDDKIAKFKKKQALDLMAFENELMEKFNEKCLNELDFEHNYFLMRKHKSQNDSCLKRLPKRIAERKRKERLRAINPFKPMQYSFSIIYHRKRREMK